MLHRNQIQFSLILLTTNLLMTNFHPWHNVSFGEQAPEIVTALIEIPKGSKAKYEVDKVSGLLKLDRVLFSSVFYPANYGFIPQTLGDDHDPLDILVLSQIEIEPLCLVKARVIGVMRMIDNNEGDDKIIAVAENDMSVNHIKDISQLPAHFIEELQNFFENYTKLEKKKVRIDGFQNTEQAKEIIVRAIELYKKTFAK